VNLEGGTREELVAIHKLVFGHQPPVLINAQRLRASILTAISPLRLDFEVNRLRGRAITQEA
jgi:hypothetical protein